MKVRKSTNQYLNYPFRKEKSGSSIYRDTFCFW
jgi:hypothetical protein